MSADLNKMAVAFNTSVANLEDELTQLILDDQISARIDSHTKVKWAKHYLVNSMQMLLHNILLVTIIIWSLPSVQHLLQCYSFLCNEVTYTP